MAICPDAVLRLIDKFQQQSESLKSPEYNETQLRIDYINPFFRELGWDLDNTQGFAEQYREVVHEDRVKVAGQTKAPDYSFRIGGHRKFFLEAKKPAVDIRSNWEPAYQLRRYAWSAKLACSLLTDFEEFAIYDARIRPKQLEKASVARRELIAYTDYPTRWDFIEGTFSKSAVLRGEFDRYCDAKKGRGAEPFDDAFLNEIEEWRTALATTLASRNAALDQSALNFAVQRIIDRILFLRIAEDRGTETPGQLQALLNGDHAYERLCKLFRDADARYNSGLFHFQKERDRDEAPDTLTPSLDVADKTLKDIIRALYYPQSPYEFTVVSADILGSVYERFLGKVITLTPAHRAKVEDKPEVRKAGGVYYTPAYIVEYIVNQTVGKLLEGKTPKDAAKLRVLDPACGSGSFLIGAYHHLLNWYLDQYSAADPASLASGPKPVLRQSPSGGWALTIAERKRILLDHIHGVDLDAQAVEVTKLNLLLKCLEGESGETLGFTRGLFKERALPDLGKNILCGNSLIGTDIIGTEAWNAMSQDERARVNPFDYERAFPHVFKGKNPGFDAVIGNPPYGFHEIHSDAAKKYLKSRYSIAQGSYEHYLLFFELSLRSLRQGGSHGFITPVTWLTIPSARALRRLVLHQHALEQVVWLPKLVFKNAQVNTLISVTAKRAPGATRIEIHDSLGFRTAPQAVRYIEQSSFITDDDAINIFIDAAEKTLLDKLSGRTVPLSELARPCSGYNPYEVGAGYGIDGRSQSKRTVVEKPYHSDRRVDSSWSCEVVGRDIERYSLRSLGGRWVKYGPWLAAPRDPSNFDGPRLLVQEVVGGPDRRIHATFFDAALFHSRDVIAVKTDSPKPSPKYLLGIVNSRLITWYHQKRNPKAKKDLFPKVLVSDLAKLPVVRPDDDQERLLSSVVDTMLSLLKRLAEERTPQRREQIQREIDATDRQIDAIVYQLYGLTDDEIKIVEDATRSE